MIPIAKIIDRLRYKVDLPTDAEDNLTGDGTTYTFDLSNSPIPSGSEEVYINNQTYTTGVNQYIYQYSLVPPSYAASNYITYTIDYNRGILNFYQGSGYLSGNLTPFPPWNTSDITVDYEYTKYTDSVLDNYCSYAVAVVEASLHIGMYVTGVITGPAPDPRSPTDEIDYMVGTPYAQVETFAVAEDLEILQELIAQRASIDLLTRERRIGAGNAIKLQDGDTMVDTAIGQKYMTDLIRDLKLDYQDTLKYTMYSMFEGFTIKQVDERAGLTTYGYGWRPGLLPTPSDY